MSLAYLVHLTKNTSTKQQVLDLEVTILTALDYRLETVTPYDLLHDFTASLPVPFDRDTRLKILATVA